MGSTYPNHTVGWANGAGDARTHMMPPVEGFSARLTDFEQLLHKRQSDDGGWPQKLEIGEAPTSIVATAHALEILRIRGLQYDDPQIQGGLHYLAGQVAEQTSARQGGRGESSRFPAYALWGIMRYPESRHDPTLASGIVFATKWLRANALPAGGWSRSKDRKEPLWLPGTMVAVHALERHAIYSGTDMAHEIQALTNQARDHIAENGHRKNGSRMYWTQLVGGSACPGATSLAVLILARGSQLHRDAARAGIEWLGANRELWTSNVHTDNLIAKRLWRIQSFSLGLRALMHPCGERDVGDPAVAQVLSHFNSLWRDGNHGWADEAGLEASMSAGYAVTSAVQTLKRVWEFDPYEQLGVPMQHRDTVKSPPPRAHRILHVCTAERSIRLEDDRGNVILQTHLAGKSQWPFVLIIAQRHRDAVSKGVTNKTEMTVSLEEYASALKTKPESVIRTRRRLHQKLVKEARKQSQRAFVELIEDHFPPETTEQRFALEEIEVHFVDILPTVRRVAGRVSSGHRLDGVSDRVRRPSMDSSATKIA